MGCHKKCIKSRKCKIALCGKCNAKCIKKRMKKHAKKRKGGKKKGGKKKKLPKCHRKCINSKKCKIAACGKCNAKCMKHAKKKVPIFMQMMKGGKKCHAACQEQGVRWVRQVGMPCQVYHEAHEEACQEEEVRGRRHGRHGRG